MNTHEAIKILRNTAWLGTNEDREKTEQAIEVVAEALEQEPKTRHFKVVRCRECEYWKCNPNTKNYGVCGKVSYDDFEVVMERDDFCSYGIRIK